MSRNLNSTSCTYCGDHVVLDEASRLITRDDAGIYYELRDGYSYAGMICANAHCRSCNAQYLAWIDLRSCLGYGRGIPNDGFSWGYNTRSFFDLSFRKSFNDEPDLEDLPDWIFKKRGLREPWPRCSRCGRKVMMFSADATPPAVCEGYYAKDCAPRMPRTRVVNLKAAPYDVYAGRPLPDLSEKIRGEAGIFGNPFPARKYGRELALILFKTYFLYRVDHDDAYRAQVLALRGKVLGCFCLPKPCHATIIAEWIDAHPNEISIPHGLPAAPPELR